jgi:poly-gamma-glutamate synthesis protein (capsule biosynthesis protein)
MQARHRRLLRGIGFGFGALLALTFLVTEYVYYFPLTPLSLDIRGTTRLPASPDRIRLLFVGDVLLGDAARTTLEARGYGYAFGATRQLISAADLAIGNLEGPIAVRGERSRRKRWAYKMSPRAARALRRAGFDVMDLANNHIRDCGNEGVRETLRYLREAGIDAFGAGVSAAGAHRPVIREVRGVRVALLGYVPPHMLLQGRKVSLRGLTARRGLAGAAWGTLANIRRDIRAARARADVVIVSLHLGDRYQRHPAGFERDHCRRVIDAGADAVIGHGTHILGPIGTHRGRPIFYGLGNFTFGSGNLRARFSLMGYLDLDPATKRVVGLGALPIYTANRNPWVWYQTKVLTGSQARRVLRRLIRISWRYNSRLQLRSRPARVTMDL